MLSFTIIFSLCACNAPQLTNNSPKNGAKLVSYKHADPIENTFKEKFTFARFEPTIN